MASIENIAKKVKMEDLALLFYSKGNILIGADEESCKRLHQTALIDAENHITVTGQSIIAVMQRVLEESAKGVPFENRKWTGLPLRKSLLAYSDSKWVTATYMKKHIITNDHILFVSSSLRWIDEKSLELADPKFRQMIPILWGKMKDLVAFYPHTYQIGKAEPFGYQIVWLANEDQTTILPVAAHYFDAIMAKFPTATFWHQLGIHRAPFYAKVPSRGVRNVVSIVAPVEFNRTHKPALRAGWREWIDAMQKQSVPTVRKEAGSSL